MILRRRDKVVVMSDPPESIESSSSSAEDIDLRQAISGLEEVSRTIVKLHYYRD